MDENVDKKKQIIKKADNIYIEKKASINNIDNQIAQNELELKRIGNIEENVVSLSKNLDCCISILSEAMKGPKTNALISDIDEKNAVSFAKLNNSLDEARDYINKNLKNLYQKKDEIKKENSKE